MYNNLNAEKLKTLRIPKVSFKEQNEFVKAFKNVEKVKNLNFVFDKINEMESLFINSKKIVNYFNYFSWGVFTTSNYPFS